MFLHKKAKESISLKIKMLDKKFNKPFIKTFLEKSGKNSGLVKTLILDFDSTFITLESLDLLLGIALQNQSTINKQPKQLNQIQQITRQGMTGQISFQESLQKRLKMAMPSLQDLKQAIQILEKNISPSILKNKKWFKQNTDKVWIISGGFQEMILPIVKNFGIKPNQVLANSFKFNKQGEYIGYDQKNLLAQNQGKIKAVKKLKIPASQLWIVGDGWTDYELKKAGLVEKLIYFAENVNRKTVSQKADWVVKSFDQILKI